jgi:hypothetical protein
MRELIGSGDIEASHGEADDLLIEALRFLVEEWGPWKDEVNKLIDSYNQIDKWYA